MPGGDRFVEPLDHFADEESNHSADGRRKFPKRPILRIDSDRRQQKAQNHAAKQARNAGAE